MKTYTVNVGNIGNIDAPTRKAAEITYREYCQQSRLGYGRASGETVTLLVDGESVKEYSPTPRKGTLARFIFDKLENEAGPFDVIAYELTHDGQSWSVNTPWKIATSASLPEVMEAAQGRWEVFKANYSSKATVKGLSDIGEGDTFELESDYIPFLQIRPSDS